MSFTRHFPPLYTSTANAAADRLAFFHILERLKSDSEENRLGEQQHPRRRKAKREVASLERYPTDILYSIADHMYRMAVLAMCTSDPSLNISKCVMMCIVHDLAEAQVGDISPSEGIPKEQKQRLEAEAMHNFTHDMLHNSVAAQQIESLWHEYEEGATPEARFVKDLDRFEMASQALEYEKRHQASLQPFFDSSLPKINHPEVKAWGTDLLAERQQLQQPANTIDTNTDQL